MTRPILSIIIVYFKGKANLLTSIRSIIRSKPKTSYEIIIVDNNQNSELEGLFKPNRQKIKYVKSKNNLGYGAGNNLGASYAKGKYLFILNPDTKVYKYSIDLLVEFLERNKKAAIVAPNLVDQNGKIYKQMGSRLLTPLRGIVAFSFINKLFPDNPLSKKYWVLDVPTNQLRELDAVPGSAFIVRKDIFEKVGKFDENIFLFFEESDIGKRIREKGYKIFINPRAKVMHRLLDKKDNSVSYKKYFEKSRFYYFKKHYGVLSAFLVEALARLSKYYILLIAITILGSFLRFYRIQENLLFNAEQGHNYLAIKNFLNEGIIPLLGPPTSHPWLHFGPYYYWIMAPLMIIGKFNPLVGAYFMAFIGSLIIVINFFVIAKIFNKRIALISSYFITISPSMLSLTRSSRFFLLVIVFFYPFIYCLSKALSGSKKSYFWTGLFLGLMINFHFSAIMLIPAVLTLCISNKNTVSKKSFLFLLIGLLVPSMPFFIYNLNNNFSMLGKFIIWIPYRIAGFLGIIEKNKPNLTNFISTFNSFHNFMSQSITVNILLGEIVFYLISILILYKTYQVIKKRKSNINLLIILSIFYWTYLGIFIHGGAPQHYYLPIYLFPIILFAFLINLMWRKKYIIVALLLIILVTFINSKYYFSNNWFFKGSDFEQQIKIAKLIIQDNNNEAYELRRFGVYDEFEGDFAQNYQYLLWLYGNEPVKVGDIIVNKNLKPIYKYIIFEEPKKQINNSYAVLFNLGDYLIAKEII